MNEEELKQYFEIYTVCWKLFKKYSNPTQDKSFWEQLTEESKAIYKRYPNELTSAILIATLEQINTIFKQKGN